MQGTDGCFVAPDRFTPLRKIVRPDLESLKNLLFANSGVGGVLM